MISVIIPFYNAEKTILTSLESVKNQHGNYTFEIIVINDGSTDTGKEKVENFIKKNPNLNIQLINQENKGVSSARNAGLKIAKGEYIALLDADDEWLPIKTKNQMQYFENKNWDIDFLATARNNSKILFPYKIRNNLAEVTFKKLLIRNEITSPSVIFKKKVLENTGYFDENQHHAEDVNYWMKVSFNNKMYILNESLIIAGKGKRTFGVSGLSANLSGMEKGFRKNIEEMYSLKKINFFQYQILRIFYKAKYLFLLLRQFYYKKMS